MRDGSVRHTRCRHRPTIRRRHHTQTLHLSSMYVLHSFLSPVCKLSSDDRRWLAACNSSRLRFARRECCTARHAEMTANNLHTQNRCCLTVALILIPASVAVAAAVRLLSRLRCGAASAAKRSAVKREKDKLMRGHSREKEALVAREKAAVHDGILQRSGPRHARQPYCACVAHQQRLR